MSFWINNPLKLFGDLNVIPNSKQPYAIRMNTLTRLIILFAIILYILKIEGSLQFLIFGILFIIILYYSQSEDMQKTRESFLPQGIANEHTPIGNIVYNTHNGPGRPEYRRIPIEGPSPAMAHEWGGYQSQINNFQGTILPTRYENEISWHAPSSSPSSSSSFYTLPAPPIAPQIGEFGSIGIVGQGTNKMYTGTPLPFALSTSSVPDNRFVNGTYVHRKVQSNPGYVQHYPQPLNRGGGLEKRENVTTGVGYQGEQMLSWNPEHIQNPRTSYQRDIFPYDNDDRTGNYRSASTIGGSGQYNPRYSHGGDGYRNIGDLPGNNQYYVTNSDPFAGMFAIRSESSHMDILTADGNLIPYYKRDGTKVDDYIQEVSNLQIADELYFRDSMTEAIAAKIASTEYQYRMGPVRMA